MMKRSLFALALLASTAAHAPAQDQLVNPDDVATVQVLPGWRTDSGTHISAIKIQLAPGWKTYWRAPGDAGIPPQFAWDASRNLDSVQFYWPTPKVFEQNGMRSIGYSDQVVIPVELTPSVSGGAEINLRVEMDLGVCLDVCLPLSVALRADLGSGSNRDPAILASLNTQPTPADQSALRSVTCKVDPISDGLRVTATLNLPHKNGTEVAVMEVADQTVWVSESIATRNGAVLTVTSDLVPPNAAPFLLNRSDIRITVLGQTDAIDVQGCPGG